MLYGAICPIPQFFTSVLTVKSSKLIKILAGILIILLALILLVIGLGNFALDRYLNADGQKDLTKYLPINGTATYDHANVKVFKSFLDVTVQLEGLKVERFHCLTEPLLFEKMKTVIVG